MISLLRKVGFVVGCLLFSACIHDRSGQIDAGSSPATQSNAGGFTASLGELYASTTVRIPCDARMQGYYNEHGNNKYILASFRMTSNQVNKFLSTVPYPPRKPKHNEQAWFTGEEIENNHTWWFPELLENAEGNKFQIGQWSQFTFLIERPTESEYSYLFIRVIDAR